MRSIGTLLILAFLAGNAAAQSTQTKMKVAGKLRVNQEVRVVCFGDSVTGVYYHTGSRRAYTDMLGIALRKIQPGAKVKMVNAGISGNTTVNALARIDRDVLKHRPDLVTVMFGLNDMVRVSLEQYRKNLQRIVKKCRGIGAEVVLATPNNVINTSGRPTAKLIKYCDVVSDVARELDAPLCDVYRQFESMRKKDAFAWRLLMSDAIHPNMDGHKQIATALAKTITGRSTSLGDVSPEAAIAQTLQALRDKKSVRILAMPPFDKLIRSALLKHFPKAKLQINVWETDKSSLAKIEQDAKARVRKLKPDLVIIAVPRSAKANNAEAFANSYAWIMNWSLNFGPPTLDCVVVHPSVTAPIVPAKSRDPLVRQLVKAQHLHLIDRASKSDAGASEILEQWLGKQTDNR